jgi:Acetyltransferases, including N-acetylases of ribosomal proteins
VLRVDDRQLPEYFAWLSDRLGETFVHGPDCKCLANVRPDGSIAAVAVYLHLRQHSCELNLASDGSRRWLTRGFLYWLAAVPFVQWDMQRVTAIARLSNGRSIRLLRHAGFVGEGVLRRAYGDEDGLVMGLLRGECRFLKLGERNVIR